MPTLRPFPQRKRMPPELRRLADSHAAEQELSVAARVESRLANQRWGDYAYVVELIRKERLNVGFAEQLHPAVRETFIWCVEQRRIEDEWDEQADRIRDKQIKGLV